MNARAERPFKVVALLAAFNEDDVIDCVLGDLVRQRIDVYFIDNHSTDSTMAIARSWLGRGVVGVESFPPEADATDPADGGRYPWTDLLHRKEDLAATLDADWFIHQDADEFRESPWADQDLLAAIELVDRFGYNAIDFRCFQFQPTDDRFPPGADVREYLTHYEPPAEFDALRINCWRRVPGVKVDLASQGGHEALFEGRRVFPIRFLLRHYPLRSQAHAERKIHLERRPRFLPEERAKGWHRQYNEAGHDHLRSPRELRLFDLEAARLEVQIENRLWEDSARELGETLAAHAAVDSEFARLTSDLERARDEMAALADRLVAATNDRDELALAAQGLAAELANLRAELRFATARVDELLSSKSWRWTRPLRALLDFVAPSPRRDRP